MRAVSSIILTTATATATATTAFADDYSDALDEGTDTEIADTYVPDPIGPDGTYGSYADLRFRITGGSGSWASDRTTTDAYGREVIEYRAGELRELTSFRVDLVGSPGLRPHRGGVFIGAGIEYARAEGSLITASAHRSIHAAHLLFGWGRPLGERFQLEGGVMLQAGRAAVTEMYEGALTPTLGGMHGAVGVDASLVYTDSSGWQLGITMTARHDGSLVSDPHDYEVSVSGSSKAYGAFLGKRY